MGLKNEIEKYTLETLTNSWDKRDGQKVPNSEDIKLGNEAVKLNAVVLYADLDKSTELVNDFKPWFSAEIYKIFLYCSAKVIRKNKGVITSFDGDRIMAVFIGGYKNTLAVKTALKINYVVKEIINPSISSKYKSGYQVKQVVGIDNSELFIARTGIRGSNDLVWVGKSANYAAKLSDLTPDYPTRITESVFKKINKEAKFGKNGNSMWEKVTWKEMNNLPIYRSNWYWEI